MSDQNPNSLQDPSFSSGAQTLDYPESLPITSQPEAESKPRLKPFIEAPQGEGTRNQPLGSEALGDPVGCGPDQWGKWLMACGRC
ncbi:uncharacterized protein IL334_004737 [Kwoniella shivajii]|uniref:Uncharacterized protein n=1 Tax=Kwoniella shivajii TaxID=564305 RepID=A0ABZ1D167_9TREE|nr:hypothetical protein IL334_004737 [Kwoniella shivajii]